MTLPKRLSLIPVFVLICLTNYAQDSLTYAALEPLILTEIREHRQSLDEKLVSGKVFAKGKKTVKARLQGPFGRILKNHKTKLARAVGVLEKIVYIDRRGNGRTSVLRILLLDGELIYFRLKEDLEVQMPAGSGNSVVRRPRRITYLRGQYIELQNYSEEMTDKRILINGVGGE